MFQLSYKCRLCGDIIIGRAVDITSQDAVQLINKTIAMEQYMNGLTGTNKMTAIHNCANGGIGIADFQGFKQNSKKP